jgi:hypothetical protein
VRASIYCEANIYARFSDGQATASCERNSYVQRSCECVAEKSSSLRDLLLRGARGFVRAIVARDFDARRCEHIFVRKASTSLRISRAFASSLDNKEIITRFRVAESHGKLQMGATRADEEEISARFRQPRLTGDGRDLLCPGQWRSSSGAGGEPHSYAAFRIRRGFLVVSHFLRESISVRAAVLHAIVRYQQSTYFLP